MIGPIHDFGPWRVPAHVWAEWDAIPDVDPHPPQWRRPLIQWLPADAWAAYLASAPAAGEGEEHPTR